MLLLIENCIPNRALILECLDPRVTPVFFDYTDSFDTLASNIPEKKYNHMAILQKQTGVTYSLLHSFGQSNLQDVAYLDPSLESWTSFSLFLELCVSRLEIKTLDLIGCVPSSLDYVSRVWNFPFRYSEKDVTQLTFESFRECPILCEYFTRISPVPNPVPPVPNPVPKPVPNPVPTPVPNPVPTPVLQVMTKPFTQRNIMNQVIHRQTK